MSVSFRARIYHKERITASYHRKFYVYKETGNNNQLNDHSTLEPNTVCSNLLEKDSQLNQSPQSTFSPPK